MLASNRLNVSLVFFVLTSTAFLTLWGGPAVLSTTNDTSDGQIRSRDKIDPKDTLLQSAANLVDEGRKIFRFDTFGNESFWGDSLRLHEAIAGINHGGVGDGVSPRVALSVGLKVDVDALPRSTRGLPPSAHHYP